MTIKRIECLRSYATGVSCRIFRVENGNKITYSRRIIRTPHEIIASWVAAAPRSVVCNIFIFSRPVPSSLIIFFFPLFPANIIRRTVNTRYNTDERTTAIHTPEKKKEENKG